MLILSRKSNESIVLFVDSSNGNGKEEVVIKVLEIHGNKVKIGVAASKDVIVAREEILEEEV